MILKKGGVVMVKNQPVLFEKAKESKVLSNGMISTVLLFLMIIVGQIIGGIILEIIRRTAVEIGIFMETLELILSFLFPLLLCLLWVKFVEKRKISSLGLMKEGSISNFLKGFLIGFLMFSTVTLMMYISGTISIEQNINKGIKFIPGILIILPGWILQSSTEEILSRGWLMHVVGARHKPIIGFIVSSVMFGFLHILNPGVDLISIVNIVLVGFMFGLYVINTQDTWGACGLHAAWNFSQGNIYGFSVSGLNASSNSLLTFSSKGSTLLTGGKFGPEASIFSTIVLGIAIIILIIRLKEELVIDSCHANFKTELPS